MATNLGKPTWGSGPSIKCQFDYEYYRSGANMYYRVIGYVNTEKKQLHFGYYIIAHVYLDGVWKYSKTLKNNDPAYWSDQLSFDSGYQTVEGKVSGSTQIRIRFETNADRGDGNWYYTGTVSPAGSDISASNGELGVEQTITLTRRNSAFTDTVTWQCGTQSGTIAEKSSGTSFKFTPPVSLASENTTGTTVPITFKVETYSGNTLIQSKSVAVTETIPASVKPMAQVTIDDPTGNAAKYGAYVQSKSTLHIVVTPTLSYGSAINSYSINADNAGYNTGEITTPVLQNTGAQSVTASVTDKRGCTSDEASAAYNVLPYEQPNVSTIEITRCDQNGVADPEGHYMLVRFTGKVTALNNINSATYNVRYRVQGTTQWVDNPIQAIAGQYTPTYSFVTAAADANTFDVEVVIMDDFGAVIAASGVIPVAYTIMNWRPQGDGMAIGGINTKPGLQVYMDTDFIGDAQFSGDLDLGLNVIPIENGGTSADNADDACDNLGLYFKPGDVWNAVKNPTTSYAALITGGILTSSQKALHFSVHTPKSMKNVSPTVVRIRENCRTWNGYLLHGSYIDGGYLLDSRFSFYANKLDDYTLTITIYYNSGTMGSTNNVPIGVEINELVISFA